MKYLALLVEIPLLARKHLLTNYPSPGSPENKMYFVRGPLHSARATSLKPQKEGFSTRQTNHQLYDSTRREDSA